MKKAQYYWNRKAEDKYFFNTNEANTRRNEAFIFLGSVSL